MRSSDIMSKVKIAAAGGLAYIAAVAVGYNYGRGKPDDNTKVSAGINLTEEQRRGIYTKKASQYDKG